MIDKPAFPSLTDAEKDFVDVYLSILDRVGRINPGTGVGKTYSALRAAQALVSDARALREILDLMMRRGEREIFGGVLTRALLEFDGGRRSRRIFISADRCPDLDRREGDAT